MIIADARYGRVLWRDATVTQSAPLSEGVVKSSAQDLVRPLP